MHPLAAFEKRRSKEIGRRMPFNASVGNLKKEAKRERDEAAN